MPRAIDLRTVAGYRRSAAPPWPAPFCVRTGTVGDHPKAVKQSFLTTGSSPARCGRLTMRRGGVLCCAALTKKRAFAEVLDARLVHDDPWGGAFPPDRACGPCGGRSRSRGRLRLLPLLRADGRAGRLPHLPRRVRST